MFLATTALQDFWSEEEEIRFLGPWCLRGKIKNASDLVEIRKKVLLSPWEDRTKFHTISMELESCHEKLLDYLGEYLNSVHGTSYSKRYWKILLGHWLHNYLCILCDRFFHLLAALDTHPNLTTKVLDPISFKTPWTMREFVYSSLDDEYNLQIFSELLLAMGYSFPTKKMDVSNYGDKDFTYGLKAEKKLEAQDQQANLAKEVVPHVLLGEMCCDGPLLNKLVQALSGFGSYWPYQQRTKDFSNRLPICFNKNRLNLASLDYSNELERLFIHALPQHFPGLYLEGFDLARQETYNQFPKFPSVLLTLNEWYSYDRFKFLAAEACEAGSRLVVGQHGGGYGVLKHMPQESYEVSISDRYLTWGWSDGSPNLSDLPSFKTSFLLDFNFHKGRYWKSNKLILFISTYFQEYLPFFSSFPVGHEVIDFCRCTLDFFDSLPSEVRQMTLWRGRFPDSRIPEKKIIQCEFPDVCISEFKDYSHWGSTYHKSLAQARVIVLNNYFGTSLIESLVLNIPTVVFGYPQYWEPRPEAEPYFDELQEVGILWEDPVAAARHLSSIYEKPWIWWESEKVQQVRHAFVERYGKFSKNWLQEWIEMMKEELKISMLQSAKSGNNKFQQEIRDKSPHSSMLFLRSKFFNYKSSRVYPKDLLKNNQASIKDKPYLVEPYLRLAKILQVQGKTQEALRAYQRAFSVELGL